MMGGDGLHGSTNGSGECRIRLRQSDTATPQCVPGIAILAFERRNRLFGDERFAARRDAADLRQCRSKFIYVDLPVAAAFQHAAERDDGGEYGVPMPASCQMADLGP